MESNHFMLECASICPETTHQKLESQRLYLSLKTIEDRCKCDFMLHVLLCIIIKWVWLQVPKCD